MLQTWNAKMDFRRDLITDVKTKEETFDVGPPLPAVGI
jgi:cysteinyl-tRNA synthetase